MLEATYLQLNLMNEDASDNLRQISWNFVYSSGDHQFISLTEIFPQSIQLFIAQHCNDTSQRPLGVIWKCLLLKANNSVLSSSRSPQFQLIWLQSILSSLSNCRLTYNLHSNQIISV